MRWIVCIAVSCVAVVALSLGLGLGLGLGLRPGPDRSLNASFINVCRKFEGYDCIKVWQEFEKAYVGKDACLVPPQAYESLMKAAPFKPTCNKMMLWSKSKDIVSELTDRRKCYIRLESTMLGAALNNKVWCGAKGSKETWTKGCPGWVECVNNPVRSFWNKASEKFADSACGAVTVMLNGSESEPFDINSMFASVELPRLVSPKVTSLKVVLVTSDKPASCTNPSVQKLSEILDGKRIQYSCKEVPRSRIIECASDTSIACESCW